MPFSPGQTPFGYFDNDVSFQEDADKVVTFVRLKLGAPVICPDLSSSHVYAAFEEAVIELGSTVNAYQAKSQLVNFLGTPTGSLSGSENKYPERNLEFQRRMAEPYGEEALLNGSRPLYSASIDLQVGQQRYDLQALVSGSGFFTGSLVEQRIIPREVFHFSPISAYRFFGTTSAVNFLNTQFNFESFTPETIFYLLPIWEDILRGMQFKTSNVVRRSNFSYEIQDNVLTLFPCPTQNNRLFFTFQLAPNPTQPGHYGARPYNGVSNLSNLPFGNIPYSGLNSISKSWIRRMTLALAKEMVGQMRSKMTSVPIPNGDLTLNGPEMINDARAEMDALRTELRDLLADLTYDKLMEREAQQVDFLEQQLARIPLGFYVGNFGPIFLALWMAGRA